MTENPANVAAKTEPHEERILALAETLEARAYLNPPIDQS